MEEIREVSSVTCGNGCLSRFKILVNVDMGSLFEHGVSGGQAGRDRG